VIVGAMKERGGVGEFDQERKTLEGKEIRATGLRGFLSVAGEKRTVRLVIHMSAKAGGRSRD